jgi:glycosyltransferase involved in cell wall biosynthesis
MNHYLSVCIPTYNRCKILIDSIEEIIPLLIKRNIEICISNNASTDDTDLYLSNLIKRYPQIKYQRQTTNVGIDQNMIDVIKMATGDFILPLGDDDKLILSNLENELSRIEKDLDIYVLNGLYNEVNHLPDHLIDKLYFTPDEAFKNLWDRMPFGSILFNKKLFDENYFNKYLNTSHAYTGVLWESLFDKFVLKSHVKIKCGVLPLIEFKQEVKTWKNDAFKIMYYEIPLWFNLLSDRYTIIKRDNILDNYIKDLMRPKCLLNYLIENDNYKLDINRYLSFCNQKQIRIARLIGIVPKPVARLFLSSLNSLKSIAKWIIRW